MRLGFESFLFYTARTGGWTMVKDFVTFKSRQWNRGASLLADRCATRKLLQRIRQREAEQELLKKIGPIAMAKAREVQHRSSVDPVPPEETPGTSQRDATTLNDTRSSAASGLDASGFMGSVTSARLAGLLDDNDDGEDQTQQQTQQSFRASFAAGAGCVEISSPTFVADDEIVLGRSATRNRRVARVVPPSPTPDHQIHRSTVPTPQPPSTRPVPRNNTTAPVVGSIRRKKTDPAMVDKGSSRAAAALEATVVAVKKKIRDQDVIRDDLSLLYQQAASSPESLFISYSDMFLEQRNVKKRNGEARKDLDALKNTKHELLSQLEQVRVVATTPSSPSASTSHTAPVMVHSMLAQQLDQVEESIAVLQHEIHLLDVMLAVPTSDLES
ncbi:Hypothetical protein, putative [Bodo saltans]|uniref:Uncharacterized protein n=1 Tax=Bodo saltans TaxID=75058 RepID=A0A0S4J0K5_BODSA|nr:Hypothetical protein, putative [Bodo saltans]|eukprot:CUG46696.1 Hypothetical protein, putative [Bodo saltans]